MTLPKWRALAVALATTTLISAAVAVYALTRPAGAQPTPAASTTTSARVDARTVLDRLVAAGLPATNPAVQDETSDPNHLLGRPGGYLSRASFDLPEGDPTGNPGSIDRGGVIEVWPSAAGAETRSVYIRQTLAGMPALGTEYHYRNGPILVRITGLVPPSTAAAFETAVANL